LRESFEALAACASIEIVRLGDGHQCALFADLSKLHDPICIRIRERTQQYTIHDAEDRGARADSQR
jgi:hypothetical protein